MKQLDCWLVIASIKVTWNQAEVILHGEGVAFTLSSAPKAVVPWFNLKLRALNCDGLQGLTQACNCGLCPNEPGQQSIKWQQVATPTTRATPCHFKSYSNALPMDRFRPFVTKESGTNRPDTEKPRLIKGDFCFMLRISSYTYSEMKTQTFLRLQENMSNCALVREINISIIYNLI